MASAALARKWRPQRFEEVVGQPHVVDALSHAIASEKLHHAYLFSGTRGVGKTTLARIFAKRVNCLAPQQGEPCGQCDHCQAIEQGQFVDVIEVDAASRTKVEDTRELLDNVQYKPTQGQYKIYIIDEVHMLSLHSFNALLKTLEEPPAHMLFMLATTDPQKLPVTVLSRCMHFHLQSVTATTIANQIGKVLSNEAFDFEQEALARLAAAAKGSVRDALTLTDQALALGKGQVGLEQVNAMLGRQPVEQVETLLSAVFDTKFDELKQLFEQLASSGVDYTSLTDQMIEHLYEQSLRAKLPGSLAVQLFYQILLQAKRDLIYAPDERIAFEMALMRMLQLIAARPAGNQQHQQESHEENEPALLTSSPLAEKKSLKQTQPSNTHQSFPADEQSQAVDVTESVDSPDLSHQAGTQLSVQTSCEPKTVSSHGEQAQKPKLSQLDKQWHKLFEQMPVEGMLGQLLAHSQVKDIGSGKLSLSLSKRHETLLNTELQAKACEALSSVSDSLSALAIDIVAHEQINVQLTPQGYRDWFNQTRQLQAQAAFEQTTVVQNMIHDLGAKVDLASVEPAESFQPVLSDS